ncbi:MAG: cyclic 2,3-diphosphoglycerate synthase [Candidatus Thermoplasmatota archaeon]|nr:cyclic 2,3-diphosphoglycerate synthase [Candidatus Thermoplasmatota archaeon]MBU1941178.1 cyclic 2,3-diphosphoglycerate synthase [Candidatus Thermoplasmatota archaeon]
MTKRKVIIMGAAGRDFHNFNTFFRDNDDYEVVAFTATQIPDIADRNYPPGLSGHRYPKGIPIYAEEKICELIQTHMVDLVVFAYSDVPYTYVGKKSAEVNAAGADFVLMGPMTSMLRSSKPVIAVCAVRTGCGKSQVSRTIFRQLRDKGLRVASIRHPMPYDTNLEMQMVQRFATYDDLDRYNCTIEEREEYEPYIDMGGVIYAGVDYGKILAEAEKEADIIIWDGGNNDFSFYQPDVQITIADPHRPGHELTYYPGEMNVRIADIVIINKVNTAKKEDIETVRTNVQHINPNARIINGISEVTVDNFEQVKDKRVLVIEDGPTVTHGSMPYGAGYIAAQKYMVKEIIDPRPYAVGSMAKTFKKYPHLKEVLPAMGYGKKQTSELEETINRADCDLVLSGTPIDITRVISVNKPVVRVRYGVGDQTAQELETVLNKFLETHSLA